MRPERGEGSTGSPVAQVALSCSGIFVSAGRFRDFLPPLGAPCQSGRQTAAPRGLSLLFELLSALEASCRAVVVAYELEEMEMVDVAATLGIPVNTAWNRLRRGRADLRAAWRRKGASGADTSTRRSTARRGSRLGVQPACQ